MYVIVCKTSDILFRDVIKLQKEGYDVRMEGTAILAIRGV